MDKYINGGADLLDLRVLRTKLQQLNNGKSAVSVALETFYYAHDGHIGEHILLWDSETHKCYYASSLKEAEVICSLLKKGDENALAKYTKHIC